MQTNVLFLWMRWQFYEMPKFLFSVWNNYLMFAANFFSTFTLLRTFFSPWHRYKWRYPKGFDVVEFFNTLVSNTVSRILGAVMRTALIITGFLLQIFIGFFGLIIFFGWLLLPFLVIAAFLFVFVY